MTQLIQIMLANALVAAGLAVISAIVSRRFQKPKLVYLLWALVLIKLVTPPLFSVPIEFDRASQIAGQLPVAGSEVGTRVDPNGVDSPRASQIPAPQRLQQSSLPARRPAAMETINRDSNRPTAETPVVAAGPGAASKPVPDQPSRQQSSFPLSSVIWHPATLLTVLGLGAVGLLSISGWRSSQFERRLTASAVCSPALDRLAERIAHQMGLKRGPQIWLTTAAIPPLLWSVRRPRIFLPRDLIKSMPRDQVSMLLAHEMAHLKRRDHLRHWLEMFVVAAYWWHPVAWWACRRLRIAEELCCDEFVVRRFPKRGKSYARAIVATLDYLSCDDPRLPATATAMSQFVPVKRRVEMILSTKSAPRSGKGLWIVAILCAAVVLPWSFHVAGGQERDSASSRTARSRRQQQREIERLRAERDELKDQVRRLRHQLQLQAAMKAFDEAATEIDLNENESVRQRLLEQALKFMEEAAANENRADSIEPGQTPRVERDDPNDTARIEAVKRIWELQMEQFQRGQETTSEDLYRWSKRWMEAELETAQESQQASFDAIEEHRDRIASIRKLAEARFEAGISDQADVLVCDFFLAEADALLRSARRPRDESESDESSDAESNRLERGVTFQLGALTVGVNDQWQLEALNAAERKRVWVLEHPIVKKLQVVQISNGVMHLIGTDGENVLVDAKTGQIVARRQGRGR